jgi:hypothetical protein
MVVVVVLVVVVVVVVVVVMAVAVMAVASVATPTLSWVAGSPGAAAVADPGSVTEAVSERSVISPTATAQPATRPSPPKIVTRRSMTRP